MSFYRVEEDGIVHKAIGLLKEDLDAPYRRLRTNRVIVLFTAYACDTVARGREASPEDISADADVTCIACLADTRHGGNR